MVHDDDIKKILDQHHAIVTNGHFVYTAGDHGNAYVSKEALYPDTEAIATICRAMAERCSGLCIETVIGPAMGSIILSQRVAESLCYLTSKKVMSIYAEKGEDGKTFLVRPVWLKYLAGKNVLVVEDILNSGGSAQRTVELVRSHEGTVVGVTAICNRGGVTTTDLGNVPRLETLIEINLDKWPAESCPLCAKRVPINTDLGHGKEFLAQQSTPSA